MPSTLTHLLKAQAYGLGFDLVGVAALGAVVNARLDGVDAVDDPALFGSAVTWVFAAVVGVAVATVLAGVSMPRGQRVDAG